MKSLLFAKLSISAIVLASAFTVNSERSFAGNSRYFCAYLGGKPHTLVRTSRGNIPMILWESTGSWSALERCSIVSKRFQAFADNGTLKYIATGIVNSESAICAVPTKGLRCNNDNLLITLTATDRHEAARRLLDISSLAANGPVTIKYGDAPLETCLNDECYYNVNVIEEVAPIVEEEVVPIESY
jgi:hypothetical protein